VLGGLTRCSEQGLSRLPQEFRITYPTLDGDADPVICDEHITVRFGRKVLAQKDLDGLEAEHVEPPSVRQSGFARDAGTITIFVNAAGRWTKGCSGDNQGIVRRI
jgi:hypothetical protein